MAPSDELIARYDEQGHVVGAVGRARMRQEGLWHAAASVLVLSPDRARVYVHRRTDTKDVYPGMHDCWAGGVVADGEHPDETAARELGEELGIAGARPEPVLRTRYVQGSVRYHAFLYETHWAGPIVHQAAEIAAGGWMGWDELHAQLGDPDWPFVPDGRQLLAEWLDTRGRCVRASGQR